MICREINIKSLDADSALTELMFEIATARVDEVELLRFNIPFISDEKNNLSSQKVFEKMQKQLRSLKQTGQIQFFATPSDFQKNATEAVFLINKYPEVLDISEPKQGTVFVYVKI